jgi:hypothetical protein
MLGGNPYGGASNSHAQTQLFGVSATPSQECLATEFDAIGSEILTDALVSELPVQRRCS